MILDLAVECAGAHKILFASDYPLLLYPREEREPSMAHLVNAVVNLEMKPEEKQMIMGDNSARMDGRDRGKREHEEMPPQKLARAALSITRLDDSTSARWLAERQPRVRAILEKSGIPWQDSPVPFWDPLGQAARSRGKG